MNLEDALIALSLLIIFLSMALSFYAAVTEKEGIQQHIDQVMRMALGMLLGTVVGWFTNLIMKQVDIHYLSFVGALGGTVIGYLWGFMSSFMKEHINSRFTEAAEFVIIAVISMGAAGAASITMLYAVNMIGTALIR